MQYPSENYGVLHPASASNANIAPGNSLHAQQQPFQDKHSWPPVPTRLSAGTRTALPPRPYGLHHQQHQQQDCNGYYSNTSPQRHLKRAAPAPLSAGCTYADDDADQAETPTTAWRPAKRLRPARQQQDDDASDCWLQDDEGSSSDDEGSIGFRGAGCNDFLADKDGGVSGHWACSPSLTGDIASSMQPGSTYLSLRQMRQQQQSPSVQRSFGPLNTPTATLMQQPSSSFWNDDEFDSRAAQPAPADSPPLTRQRSPAAPSSSLPSFAARLVEDSFPAVDAAELPRSLPVLPQTNNQAAAQRRVLQVEETHVTVQRGDVRTEMFRRRINYVPEAYACNSDPEE